MEGWINFTSCKQLFLLIKFQLLQFKDQCSMKNAPCNWVSVVLLAHSSTFEICSLLCSLISRMLQILYYGKEPLGVLSNALMIMLASCLCVSCLHLQKYNWFNCLPHQRTSVWSPAPLPINLCPLFWGEKMQVNPVIVSHIILWVWYGVTSVCHTKRFFD